MNVTITEPRTFVNSERTILVTLWENGLMTVATREDPWATWGPPVTVRPEG